MEVVPEVNFMAHSRSCALPIVASKQRPVADPA